MGSNFNSFSPNCIGSSCDDGVLCVVAGDELQELNIVLKDVPCDDTTSSDDWELLDLSGFKSCSINFVETESKAVIGSFPGYVVPPSADGHIVAQFPADFLDNVPEYMECEVEITYESGKVTTAWNVVKFRVRSDFN